LHDDEGGAKGPRVTMKGVAVTSRDDEGAGGDLNSLA